MSYQTEIIRKECLTTSRWSGGTTTQLYISPSTALYAERNFNWRISSAVVEIEESDFTPLPGFQRIIMILEGELQLVHTDHYEVLLKPFEQDTFQGDWQTKSWGIVTDFNLMLGKECRGVVTALNLWSDLEMVVKTKNDFQVASGSFSLTDIFYIASGCADIIIAGEDKYPLKQGDLLLIKRDPDEKPVQLKVKNSSDLETRIIQAQVLAPHT